MTPRCCALSVLLCLSLISPLSFAATGAGGGPPPAKTHDYPTEGRVEYVLGCMDDNGHDFANVYKCSCAIDKIAKVLTYDDYVEQSTFSKYATLGGEGGAEFRVDRAKAQTKKYRELQRDAYKACGIQQKAAAK
ncbi:MULTISPECIES: hypothetical protein [Caballeronia]|jgi:hypothetical protein|uniref:Uncharacterized protein n=1 Tax=Caballeronia zhejiangensis TaxID=871203 RepID=A0A656Q994_9BURK|nr:MULTISPECIES: hypothetical protein [Caballeronia]EKS67424.1 hypothetical protein BURK_036309 [Burkholderia sp. SJ98]KDR25170.1 hypothetical protein BG60_30910 [Caballeronia zhejiangensis]MCG7405645.1 hypothetical protein [Caballeronia zhejiangensis]MCI1047774.1 hypothetical protein [Caballeronia zhejiangensis]MDR5768196.1 hypothetical protein [Caballeronia sp. LZ028]